MWQNRFVCPVPKWLRGKLLKFNRLYAYPVEPELIGNAEFQILDSGAYGLSLSGGKMDDEYLFNLNNHYLKFGGKNIFCVAPDTFLNFKETIKKFENWHKLGYSKVCPVIQMPKKGNFDQRTISYQLDYYSDFFGGNIDFLFFSNPSVRCIETPTDLFSWMKEKYCIEKIHNLGAGWDFRDIQDWSRIKGLDSIDTIAYYNAVNKPDGNWANAQSKRDVKAINNVKFANKIMHHVR